LSKSINFIDIELLVSVSTPSSCKHRRSWNTSRADISGAVLIECSLGPVAVTTILAVVFTVTPVDAVAA